MSRRPIRFPGLSGTFIVLFLSISVLHAQSDTLDRAERAVESEPNLSSETKSALRDMIRALREERSRSTADVEAQAKVQVEKSAAFEKALADYAAADSFVPRKNAIEKVFPHLKIFGDVRFRHESSFEQDDRADRHRQRMRFRFGANLQLYDELGLGFRLATGDLDDPNSPHNTLGQVFNKFDFSLDRVFITYQPKWAEGLKLTAGKFGQPYYANPVYGENLWDDDVQPEGVALAYTWKNDGFLQKVDFTTALYNLLETAAGDDAFVLSGQVAAHFQIAESFTSVLAIAYYAFSDPSPEQLPTILTGDNAGNATRDRNGDGTVDDFASEFGILNPILSLTYSGIENWPITVAGEFIWNTQAANSDDIGYTAGVSFGQAKSAGDWKFDYNWQSIERDAVFSPVSQDDFLFQTNHRSHLLSANYQVADTIGLRLWFLISRLDETGNTATTDSDDYQWRIRLDLNIRF